MQKAIDYCIAPLDEVKRLILDNPEKDDEKITEMFNNPGRPTLGVRVVTAMRELIKA